MEQVSNSIGRVQYTHRFLLSTGNFCIEKDLISPIKIEKKSKINFINSKKVPRQVGTYGESKKKCQRETRRGRQRRLPRNSLRCAHNYFVYKEILCNDYFIANYLFINTINSLEHRESQHTQELKIRQLSFKDCRNQSCQVAIAASDCAVSHNYSVRLYLRSTIILIPG